jgi:hypothetical protein
VLRTKRQAALLVVVAAITVAAIAFFFTPRPGSPEAHARHTAKALACIASQHGLGVRSCFTITEFRKIGSETWRVRISHVHGCFLVRGDNGATIRACKLGVHSVNARQDNLFRAVREHLGSPPED